ncbi:MAG: hypothetical protein OEM79_04935 [Nitrosopumilus sp.]|nr:hypothetical protein [Nitrosopumilus sp.]
MKNEIGRKITSLTLMTIMIAGGMTFAVPGMMPAAHAANANLFVSAENSQNDNYMSGPQVIEVVVIDSDINDTDEAKGEPDVTVNGKILRMTQAVDGNWYGYFADFTQAQIADSTSSVDGEGLDFGTFCGSGSNILAGELDVSVTDTEGIAVNSQDGVDGLNPPTDPLLDCVGTGPGAPLSGFQDDFAADDSMNVLREAKDLNLNSPVNFGQIGVDEFAFPFIQLYKLSVGGNVVVQYNKGGGAQTATLTFDTVEAFASAELDRTSYPPGADVHATITDLWLNIDPTDEDSWTFTTDDGNPHYQVFDENGNAPGDTATNTDSDVGDVLADLMCEDNCLFLVNANFNGAPEDVITIQDNGDSQLVTVVGGDTEDPLDQETAGGFFLGEVPVTVTEQGPNSGVFGTFDESDVSVLRINNDAARGTSATIDYNETPVTVLVQNVFASIAMILGDDEWNSGEEITLQLVDGDANQNSRADEDLDLNNPDVKLIPELTTGDPFTLAENDSSDGATLAAFFGTSPGAGDPALTATSDAELTVQAFSKRGLLTSSVTGGDALVIDLDANGADLHETVFQSTTDGVNTVFNLYNVDVRSIAPSGAASVYLLHGPGGIVAAGGTSLAGAPSVIDLGVTASQEYDILATAVETALIAVPDSDAVGLLIETGDFNTSTDHAIAFDFFSYGFTDDGVQVGERVANQIIRAELEETGDNTSTFEGTLEYVMVNQLNILDAGTFTSRFTIDNFPTMVVIEDLTDEDSVRITYLDLGQDGVSTQISDQLEAPSHSGVVSFDADSYKVADTVNVNLEDQDLNADSFTIDIYTVVTFPGDIAFDAVGAPGLPDLSFGPLGRMLDITFDDGQWRTYAPDCVPSGDDGLGSTGFTMIETTKDSGVLTGNFQIPTDFCRSADADPETTTGLDLEVNYVDFRDAAGEIIEVGDSAGIRAHTGSISLDRTVYPVPFGVPGNYDDIAGDTSPDNRSLFPIHATGIDDLADDGTAISNGDLSVHVRVNDPDFDISGAGEDQIAQNTAAEPVGPVKVSVIRGSETVILGFAGGPNSDDGLINVGDDLDGDGMVANGEVTIDSSTGGFDSLGTVGSASGFGNGTLFSTEAVEITQGGTTITATFTDNADNGLDSGEELSGFAANTFTTGPITISDTVPALGTNIVAAQFTNGGTIGLGSGDEISNISSFGAGAVLICQTAISSDCATGTFVNIGTNSINDGELDVLTSEDIDGTLPVTITLTDTTGPTFGSGATAAWDDLNGDTNVDDTELTIISTGSDYDTGDIIDLEAGATFLGTAEFTDSDDTLETDELTIVPSPSGVGFDDGPVVVYLNPNVPGVSAQGTFVDAPTVRQFGPINEIAPDAGIFEIDLTISYTDGPADATCPETDDFDLGAAGLQGELTRFRTASPSGENYCILQGDILQVEYTDPADASGDPNTVTDSATFDLRNGVLQSDKSVYIIGSDMILTLIEPDFDLDNDTAETYDLDLVEWDSDAATVSMGDAGGEDAAFDPEPTDFRETGDSTGIFQIVIEIPEELANDRLERGEEIVLEYTDWGPSGSDFVGDEDEDVNLTLFTSNFGATVELDQKVYTWTDKAFITIVAPDHNFDGDLVDEIGESELDPIKVSTRGSDLDNYKLVETGTDTGIFTGEVILTGFTHDADGDTTTGDANGNDVVSRSPSGNGPTDGLLPADDDDGLTVSFEFSEDETVVGSALVRWNIGEVQWLEASYPASGTGVIRVIDPDMNLDPEAVDNFDVDTWSDSDAGGIDLTVTETNEATGIFEGTVFFTITDESSGHRLRVAEGDTVTAEYEDNTLPDPYTTADELDITATSLIGTVVPPLERAPAANCRVVDAFGNSLSSVSVDQQVQITCDVANGQDREQAFAYLIQVQDSDGVTVSLAWITGSLSPGQSFSPALSWIPTAADAYDITAFVWESVDNPTALSPPVDTAITVN